MLEDASETSTPVYRAPELFDIDPHSEDLAIDESVDIWVSKMTLTYVTYKVHSSDIVHWSHSYNFIVKALGCVLYAMAYHDNPFELAVARGGSLRLAVNNAKLDFPDDNQ